VLRFLLKLYLCSYNYYYYNITYTDDDQVYACATIKKWLQNIFKKFECHSQSQENCNKNIMSLKILFHASQKNTLYTRKKEYSNNELALENRDLYTIQPNVCMYIFIHHSFWFSICDCIILSEIPRCVLQYVMYFMLINFCYAPANII
jgi:hypothetical protein